MAPASPRTGFDSSRLIRALSDLVSTDPADTRGSFADRLGHWLDFSDAIALFSALGGSTGAPRGGTPVEAQALQAEFARVRATLADSIHVNGVLGPGKARIKLPAPGWHASIDGAADYLPYHRYYLAHQRDMGAAIAPLRAAVRAAVAAQSPAHKRLAALDGVMEQALGNRERTLLTGVPALLARHFDRLHQAHRAARGDAAGPDDPDGWLQPGAWLATFCKDMKTLLLAELDLRLQPVAGLLDALGNEVINSP